MLTKDYYLTFKSYQRIVLELYYKMARAAYLTDEIAYISLYNVRPILLHGYVLPFVVLYLAWLYMWFFVYGIEEYFEAGCIAVAVIGLLQILTCLFCHWFVEVKCFMTCSKVGNI